MTDASHVLPANAIPFELYDMQDLMAMRDRINDLLPNANDLDLKQELVLQFHSAKKLFNDVKDDTTTPSNQKAQVINSTSALLKQLAELQIKLYDAEQQRALEQALIELLKEADPEDRARFMDEYEKRLEQLR